MLKYHFCNNSEIVHPTATGLHEGGHIFGAYFRRPDAQTIEFQEAHDHGISKPECFDTTALHLMFFDGSFFEY